jgi:hypothetical protein
MLMRRIISIIVAVTVFCSCQQQQGPVSAEAILQPAKGGDFRGVFLGDKPTAIKRREEASSVYSMPDELIYRFESNESDSAWYEISYSFNEDGLNHISLDVYPKSRELREHLLADFENYYDERYGNSKKNQTKTEWRGLTTQGKYVTVTLMPESSTHKNDMLRLVFNETNP